MDWVLKLAANWRARVITCCSASRDEAKGGKAAEELRAEKLEASFVPLDVTRDESVAAGRSDSSARSSVDWTPWSIMPAYFWIAAEGEDGESQASALRVPVETIKQDASRPTSTALTA